MNSRANEPVTFIFLETQEYVSVMISYFVKIKKKQNREWGYILFTYIKNPFVCVVARNFVDEVEEFYIHSSKVG